MPIDEGKAGAARAMPAMSADNTALLEVTRFARSGGDGRGPGCSRRGQLALRSVAEQEHLCHCERVRMRDRQERRSHVHAGRAGRRAAVQPQLRRAKRPEHLDVLPQDAA